ALRQVVLLAAGLDARAFRLPWGPGVHLFELDREEVLHTKEETLRRLGASPACTRHVVVADLEGDWPELLSQAGFDRGAPAAFLLEGLLMYLEPEAVGVLLGKLQQVARPGSWLGVDFPDTSLLSSPSTKSFLEKFERLGCPWRFGTPDPEGVLRGYGWGPPGGTPREAG